MFHVMKPMEEGAEGNQGASSRLPRPRDRLWQTLSAGLVVGEHGVLVDVVGADGGQVPLDGGGGVVVLRVDPGEGDAADGEEAVDAVEVEDLVREQVGERLAEAFGISFTFLLTRVFVDVDVDDGRCGSSDGLVLEPGTGATRQRRNGEDHELSEDGSRRGRRSP